MPTIMLQQFIMVLILSVGLVLMYKPEASNDGEPRYRRGLFDWSLRISISVCSYVVFYFLFGMLNANLFTENFYYAQIDGLAIPSLNVVIILEVIRAALIVLSILPITLSTSFSIRKTIIMNGFTIFLVGGLLPMLQQIGSLPVTLLVTSTVEMFFQFFLTVVVTTIAMHYEIDKNIKNQLI